MRSASLPDVTKKDDLRIEVDNQPFCDGSHKKTADELDGKIYEYDDQGQRSEVR